MMSVIRYKTDVLQKILRNSKYFATIHHKLNEEEYTKTPQYPPILDLSYEKDRKRRKAAMHEEIARVKTVEEKQIKLNMPRYWGFNCYMFLEETIPYNDLQLVQHITRTHLTTQNSLPEYYNTISKIDELAEIIRPNIEETIIVEHEGYDRQLKVVADKTENVELEHSLSSSISQKINRTIINHLAMDYSHLVDAQVDIDPRIESFWFAGGMIPPENVKRFRKGHFLAKKLNINEPVDRAIVYCGKPSLTLRSTQPLPAIIPFSEAENSDFEVPFFHYDPRAVGTHCEQNRRAVNIPGFWPGDPNQFGLLSYHTRAPHVTRKFNDLQEGKEAIHRQGILASFSWLQAQANFLGFTTFNDITYPLVTQCVITNGQIWSFYAYQLNTLLMHSDNTKENPKRNICWATPEIKLYEQVKDGKIVGFNDETLKMLLKFYANVPEERQNVEMRPYLSKKEKLIADYEDDDKRKWLEREYKFITSNRPRYQLPYEVYHWEKIYKIDNKTMPMEAKRRPFELNIDPWKRTYDSRLPTYIPRKLRPDMKRHIGRYAKEYFP